MLLGAPAPGELFVPGVLTLQLMMKEEKERRPQSVVLFWSGVFLSVLKSRDWGWSQEHEVVPSFPGASYLQIHYSIPCFCYLPFGNRVQKLCLYPITCFQHHLTLYSHVIKHYCNTSSSQTPVDLLKGPVTCGFRPWLHPRWFGVDDGSFLVCAGDARPPWVIPHPGLVLSLGKRDGGSMDTW